MWGGLKFDVNARVKKKNQNPKQTTSFSFRKKKNTVKQTHIQMCNLRFWSVFKSSIINRKEHLPIEKDGLMIYISIY